MVPACQLPQDPAEAAALPQELSLWLARALDVIEYRGVEHGAAPLAGILGASGIVPADAAARRIAARHAARNAVLCALAHRFYPGVPVSIQAALIGLRAERFAFAQWPRDRTRAQIPASYRDTPDEYLWAAFKTGAPMPLGKRELRRVLIGLPDAD